MSDSERLAFQRQINEYQHQIKELQQKVARYENVDKVPSKDRLLDREPSQNEKMESKVLGSPIVLLVAELRCSSFAILIGIQWILRREELTSHCQTKPSPLVIVSCFLISFFNILLPLFVHIACVACLSSPHFDPSASVLFFARVSVLAGTKRTRSCGVPNAATFVDAPVAGDMAVCLKLHG